MTNYGIYLIALHGQPIDEWLSAYDPDEGDGNYPTGVVDASPDAAKAMRFPSMVTATACIWRQSVVQPTRPDGAPNRPLMAFDLMVKELPDG